MEPDPNSAPDSSTPSHFHPMPPPVGDEVVEDVVALDVVLGCVLVVNIVEDDGVVVGAVPGMHWEYQLLEYVQT